jgi:hypothetical protein
LRSSSALYCRFRRVVCVLVGGTNRTGGEHLSAWLPCASQSKRKASAQDEYSSALPFCPAPALLFRHRTGTSHVLHKSSVWPSCERASHAYRFHIVSKKNQTFSFRQKVSLAFMPGLDVYLNRWKKNHTVFVIKE